MAAKQKGGLMTDDVIDMASDALFDDLPTKTARHLRNAPRRIEGENMDDYQTLGTWEGRLRQKRDPQNQQVGDQEKSVAAFEWVMRPYGMGAHEWRKLQGGDRLVIDDQVYTVDGGEAGTSAFMVRYPLAVVQASGSDAGA